MLQKKDQDMADQQYARTVQQRELEAARLQHQSEAVRNYEKRRKRYWERLI